MSIYDQLGVKRVGAVGGVFANEGLPVGGARGFCPERDGERIIDVKGGCIHAVGTAVEVERATIDTRHGLVGGAVVIDDGGVIAIGGTVQKGAAVPRGRVVQLEVHQQLRLGRQRHGENKQRGETWESIHRIKNGEHQRVNWGPGWFIKW